MVSVAPSLVNGNVILERRPTNQPTHLPTMLIVREGSSVVGLSFVSYRAHYFGRGWVRALEMLGNGPRAFALHFDKKEVARTENGIITRANFTEEALRAMDAVTLADDVVVRVTANTGTMFNMTFPAQIDIIALADTEDALPDRQSYYMRQRWVQVFRQRDGTTGADDLDYDPLPCILTYNLISSDKNATIDQTTTVFEK
jgi:hypothetical protein